MLGSAQWGCPDTDPPVFQGFPQHSTRIEAAGELPLLPDTTNSWVGGVLAPNGRVYMVPNSHTSVLIYAPRTGRVDLSSLSGLGEQPYKWSGAVVAANGRIYCPPDQAGTVLVIDPERNTTHQLPVAAAGRWAGAVLGVDGLIYGIPQQGDPQSTPAFEASVLVIDPHTETVSTIRAGLVAADDGWYGGVLAANGRIYGIPFASNDVLVIDPGTDQVSTFPAGTTGSLLKWWGGVLTPGGEVIGVPFRQDGILAIRTGLPQLPGWMLAPQFNKF
jgi:hypothetical protein